MAIVFSNGELLRQLNNLTQTGGLYVTGKVHLMVGGVVPSGNQTLAQMMAAEAVYPGYASQTLVWAALGAYNNSSKQVEVDANVLEFRATAAPTSTVMISGYFVSDALATPLVLFWAEQLATPIAIQFANDGLAILPRLVLEND